MGKLTDFKVAAISNTHKLLPNNIIHGVWTTFFGARIVFRKNISYSTPAFDVATANDVKTINDLHVNQNYWTFDKHSLLEASKLFAELAEQL